MIYSHDATPSPDVGTSGAGAESGTALGAREELAAPIVEGAAAGAGSGFLLRVAIFEDSEAGYALIGFCGA